MPMYPEPQKFSILTLEANLPDFQFYDLDNMPNSISNVLCSIHPYSAEQQPGVPSKVCHNPKKSEKSENKAISASLFPISKTPS